VSESSKAKVFCIGFMKTGTTTMNRALAALGYRVSPDSWKLLQPIMKGDWKTVKQHIDRHDAFEDNPIPHIFKQLDKEYPGSKFILTIRDSQSWYKSVKFHIDDLRTPMHEWVFGKGKGIPALNESDSIRVYESHIDEVRNYFSERPQDLLTYNVKEHNDWSTLCDFLEQQAPNIDYPHANKSEYGQPKYAGKRFKWRRVRKRLKYPFIITYFNLRGWIPNR